MPYISDKQRRWAHTKAGIAALGEKRVKEYDKKTKGKDLPEEAPKKKTKKSFDESLSDFLSMKKSAMVNKDTQSFTDLSLVALSKLSTPEVFQNYLSENLKDLGIGETKSIPLQNNKMLKVFKVEDGIYSGTIVSEDGTITHNINKSTIPEMVAHLMVKEASPDVSDEQPQEEITEQITEEVKKVTTETDNKEKQLVINININKSKGISMEKFDSLVKSIQDKENMKEDKKEESKKEIETKKQKEDIPEISQNNDNEEDATTIEGKKDLISNIIKMLSEHHEKGDSKNVEDMAKFLVHLHKDNSKDDVNKSLSKQEKGTMAKIDNLIKADQVKRTKEENKEIFNSMLKSIIKYQYQLLKTKYPDLEQEEISNRLFNKVKECVIDRMTWDDKFLLAKRDANFDDKYLKKVISECDFEEINKEVFDQSSPEFYGKSFKMLSEKKGLTKALADALDKSHKLFNA